MTEFRDRRGGTTMKRAAISVAAAMVLLFAAAGPAAAERQVFNNWHVHSGQPGQAGVAFFPAIFGVSTATYMATPSLWAHCPNATDKALVGGDGGARYVSGVCTNELYLIHLKGVPTGNPAPPGWPVAAVTATGFTIYYSLTPR
jgi:hypothetical protein